MLTSFPAGVSGMRLAFTGRRKNLVPVSPIASIRSLMRRSPRRYASAARDTRRPARKGWPSNHQWSFMSLAGLGPAALAPYR
jgi:hypothetical protein